MKFTKLRCVGFKSFVEPTEFLIEEGLSGIVGPNGCGKSNLVEALRWVMGESSYKNMRASGMDEVIFSGSANRPSRNTAEVALFVDNSARKAPAAFNDSDELQVSRRIEREAGSAYRINGKEVRAKDVQLLFADASTGARSPSMVGQGRIGELISAKPQARRALLEEAAGISGLHSRRHEAELRLRAADQNLERLEDVIVQLDLQIDNLKRQARQARRYRNISGEIRKAEALLLHLKWTAAKSAEADAQSTLAAATAQMGQKAEEQARSARHQVETAAELPGLRETEAATGAVLQRLTLARGQIEEEAGRIDRRRNELRTRLEQLREDFAREERMADEHRETVGKLEAERAGLLVGLNGTDEKAAQLAALLSAARETLAQSEQVFTELTRHAAEQRARRGTIERASREAAGRAEKLEQAKASAVAELARVVAELGTIEGPARAHERVELLKNRATDAETDAIAAENNCNGAREREQELRVPLSEAEARVNRIDAEIRALQGILGAGGQDMFPAIIEKMRVEPGFETALGAVLGADLDLPLDEGAPARWTLVSARGDDPKLPSGVRPMDEVVQAPPELARRMAQIGIVDANKAPNLLADLLPGQRLVSPRGDVWRWDGCLASADAPSPVAQKLAQKNRVLELEREAGDAVAVFCTAAATHSDAHAKVVALADAEHERREAWRAVQRELAEAREELLTAERSVSDLANRRDKLADARDRAMAELEENAAAQAAAQEELSCLPDLADLDAELDQNRATLERERAALGEVQGESDMFHRETEARRRRIAEIGDETTKWQDRAGNGEEQMERLKARQGECVAELEAIADAPGQLEARREALMEELEAAEAKRRTAADALAGAENRLAEADRAARQADQLLSQSREEKARAEERGISAAERCREMENRIREELSCAPEEAFAQAEMEQSAQLPDVGTVERNLERLKSERERLGAVNLRAELEQTEIIEQREALVSERDDLVEAIKRLRSGIASLNREGRERLLAAFEVVNGHFARLFSHLFGGGSAELQLIESDDPLEAGLEILARPPGKRPQTMTLLSGGEQALTALALIFAVFLTNPAPICVLDEVDAPLDDHNVERFCNLMDEMVASTATRFVIITHNPITMSRMNRLFGVTMAERGVSEIVSVDLQQAERLREAG
jgi:chromosome segregation protein